MTSSSGVFQFPYRIENIPKNSQTYKASSINCGDPDPEKIRIIGDLVFDGVSRISGVPTPINNTDPVNLEYLLNQQQYAQTDTAVGMIQIWFKSTIPENFLLCDGSQFDENIYPELFSVLGMNILPDLRNQFIRGDSSGSTNIGQHVDQSDVPLPEHSHFYDKPFLSVTFATDKIWAPLDDSRTYVSSMSGSYQETPTSYAGSNAVQDFYPEHTVVNFIIKAKSTRAFRNSIQNDSVATASLIANVDRLFANIQLDMNNQKIINLPAPINDSDVATKLYVDQSIAGGGLINKLQNGVQSLILQPSELQTTVNLNMQSNKITNLANATSNQDALNLQTGDNRYYSNTTAINQLTLATNQLDMNGQKITNMNTGTLFNDAVILQQLQQWIALTTTLNQVPTTNTWTLPFQEITQTSTQYLMYNSSTNRINLTQAGIFDVQILIRGTYSNFNQPITFQINSSGGIIQRSVSEQQPTSNGSLTTTYTQFIVNAQPGEFWVEILSNPSVITLNTGCYLLAKKLY